MRLGTEVAFSPEKMLSVLLSMPADAILVGGQSLVFWMSYYGLPKQDGPAISKDADILGERGHVALIANAVGGIAEYPPERAITIIAGQVFIPVGGNQFMNVDVIHRMGNMDKLRIQRNAVEMKVAGRSILVMHPIDVLESRVRNYYSIKEKQNEFGLRQVELATDVATAYIINTSLRDETIAIKAIEQIFAIAKSPSGSYARKHGVEVFNAIHPSFLANHISNENFIEHRLPRLEAGIREVLGDDAGEFFKTEIGHQKIGRT